MENEKLNKDKKIQLLDMVRMGLPPREIAGFFEITRSYVYLLAKKEGISFPKTPLSPEQNRKKAAANKLVSSAISKGILQPLPCEVCGISGRENGRNIVEAHHDDYEQPLIVRWLCKQHHSDWHRTNKPAN